MAQAAEAHHSGAPSVRQPTHMYARPHRHLGIARMHIRAQRVERFDASWRPRRWDGLLEFDFVSQVWRSSAMCASMYMPVHICTHMSTWMATHLSTHTSTWISIHIIRHAYTMHMSHNDMSMYMSQHVSRDMATCMSDGAAAGLQRCQLGPE